MAKKMPLWIPYPSEIRTNRTKIYITYKGGQCNLDAKQIHSIMFYGSVSPLREKFLDLIRKYKIPVCVHRRNMTSVIWIHPNFITDKNDVLTKQIITREHGKKQKHITYKLLKHKFESMRWLIKEPVGFRPSLDVEGMRNIEAVHAARYWKKYYQKLGIATSARRDRENKVSIALNAVSKFISSIILRWVLFHHLSPYHGFLHVQTEYPALVYDLMEPHRGFIDKVVFDAVMYVNKTGEKEVDDYVGISIDSIERFLDSNVYTHTTRQIVTFQELLHGNVLALRAYLLKNANRFIVPMPGKNVGGRPVKTGYKLYGRGAGIQDFFNEVESLGKKQEKEWGV